MTSSLRNSVHRRNHKERSQLAHRSKLGLLEKHGDYVKRARDYHSKQDRLTRLRQKAAERNKDEFYFGMKGEKTKRGVHVKERGNEALPTDLVKVLKTQDEGYVRVVRMGNLKKIDKIKMELATSLPADEEEEELLKESGLLNGMKKRKRSIRFVDSETQTTSASTSTSTPTEEEKDLGWISPFSTTKRKDLPTEEPSEEDKDLEPTPSSRTTLLKELSARLTRDKHLRYAQREFEMQRLMMGKGARKKIRAVEAEDGERDDEDDEDALDARGGRVRGKKSNKEVGMDMYKPRVYKWKMERKR